MEILRDFSFRPIPPTKTTLKHTIMLLTLAWAAGGAALAQTLPADPAPSCTVPTSTFDTWFESGTPTLNGVVNPADSVSFPATPNCSFYQWSKQMFLWLTSPAPPVYGSGGFILIRRPSMTLRRPTRRATARCWRIPPALSIRSPCGRPNSDRPGCRSLSPRAGRYSKWRRRRPRPRHRKSSIRQERSEPSPTSNSARRASGSFATRLAPLLNREFCLPTANDRAPADPAAAGTKNHRRQHSDLHRSARQCGPG